MNLMSKCSRLLMVYETETIIRVKRSRLMGKATVKDATLVLVPFWTDDKINFILKSMIKYLYCVNSSCFHKKAFCYL